MNFHSLVPYLFAFVFTYCPTASSIFLACLWLLLLLLQAEGSVLAFYNPKFTSKGPGGSSSNSNGLAVSQPNQVELLATALAWGFCKGKTKTGARCNNAVDTSVSCYCQYHAIQQAKTLKKPAVGINKQGSGGPGAVRSGFGLAAAADGRSGSAATAAGEIESGDIKPIATLQRLNILILELHSVSLMMCSVPPETESRGNPAVLIPDQQSACDPVVCVGVDFPPMSRVHRSTAIIK